MMDTGGDFVKVHVSNSHNDMVAFEKKFAKFKTVEDFKKQLEITTGGNSGTMVLELYNGNNMICKIDNNAALLGSYPIKDGMRVHVIDQFTFAAENVEKFELTNTQYESRQDTLKHFLKTNKLGKYNEEQQKLLDEKKKQQAAEEAERLKTFTIGSRCEVIVKDQPRRIGEIMYVGLLDGKKGTFVGVKFDEPLGTNDGSLEGKQYFECGPKYGSFLNPLTVKVGDFPPEDYELDEI